MTVIATISIPAEEFTLGTALGPNQGLRVRLGRVVPVGDTFIPYLWAANDAIDDIRAHLGQEADIEAFSVVDQVNDEALVRVEWAEDVDGFLAALASTDAIILDGVGEADRWRFQLRFPDHEQLTAFYQDCAEDIALEVESVHNPGRPRQIASPLDITDPQREALELALQRGYFDVPRRTNVVELAEELDISDSAVSQRLRRGTQALLASLLEEEDTEE